MMMMMMMMMMMVKLGGGRDDIFMMMVLAHCPMSISHQTCPSFTACMPNAHLPNARSRLLIRL